jgi:hypothetical protein
VLRDKDYEAMALARKLRQEMEVSPEFTKMKL